MNSISCVSCLVNTAKNLLFPRRSISCLAEQLLTPIQGLTTMELVGILQCSLMVQKLGALQQVLIMLLTLQKLKLPPN